MLLIILIPIYAMCSARLNAGVSRQNPPFFCIEKEGKAPKGFSMDLAKLLAENMGLTAEVMPLRHQAHVLTGFLQYATSVIFIQKN